MAKKNKSKDIDPKLSKEKALEITIDSLEKSLGKGIIMRGSKSSFPEIGRIGSGAISLDDALAGGYGRGRIVEIYGPESSGKTTLALHAIAETQKAGGTCAFIDAEHALDIYYAANLGVDVEELLVSQPDNGEQALQVAEKLVRSGAVSLVVIDSVAALVPRKEIEGEIGDSSVGGQARIMSQAMRMLTGPIKKTDTCVIFINQIRMKIGVMFGSPETVSGGNALKFYASQRLDIRRIETLADGEDKTGIRSRVKVIKNKIGPPFKIAEVNIMFGKGIDNERDLLDFAIKKGVIEKGGAWLSFNGKSYQGLSNFCEILREDSELKQKILDAIYKPETEELEKQEEVLDELLTSD